MFRHCGLIDVAREKRASRRNRPVEDELADFWRNISQATPRHVRLSMVWVWRIVDGCGSATTGAIDGEARVRINVFSFPPELRRQTMESPTPRSAPTRTSRNVTPVSEGGCDHEIPSDAS
jgi:hypothetical protein